MLLINMQDLQGIDIRIKWPNDIYANGMKLGGILCQSVYRDATFHLIIGAGINVFNDEPTTCLASLIREQMGSDISTDLTHLREASVYDAGSNAYPVDLLGPKANAPSQELMAAISNHIEHLLGVLATYGFDSLKEEYLKYRLHTNQQVCCLAEADTASRQARLCLYAC